MSSNIPAGRYITYNELPVPKGSWQNVYDANQRKYNATLAIGVVSVIVSTYVTFFNTKENADPQNSTNNSKKFESKVQHKTEVLHELKKSGDNLKNGQDRKIESEKVLPQQFQVKYLGYRDAFGLWGIKHTRNPVDFMVNEAKNSPENDGLQTVTLTVDTDGVSLEEVPTISGKKFPEKFLNTKQAAMGNYFRSKMFPIEIISYGVQDLVYTRVFAMIVVADMTDEATFALEDSPSQFHCHAFVCDSRNSARCLTFTLAEAFQHFSKKVKEKEALERSKNFAIDLRTSDDYEEEIKDSEA